MIPALVCLASALLVTSAPAARRRFSALFIARPSVSSGRTVRIVGVVGAGAVVVGTGVGPFIAAALAAATATVRTRRGRRDRERGTESLRLLDALEAVVGELRVGAHPSAAAEVAARESGGGAAARAFAVSAARSRLGGSGTDGLRDDESVISMELNRIADAWQVAERHGLALAELLTAARADLAGRVRFRNRSAAAMAGARATATVLSGLPLLGLALGQLMGAQPLRVLLTTAVGDVLLPLGAAFVCAGLLWTDAITRKVLV
ncbi:type II secretion system F family protein [Nocardia shimofusensis]|uniref:type II secretion system F family protein n=1 Tax=Nocardia shimofusensis TaxID=228596 RepID=UPI00082FAEC0|nr:type II secretion system F family protein [Nocardia shimofusensis]